MEVFDRHLRTLARQWPALACILAAVTVAGFFFSSCGTTTYTAKARILLRENPAAIAPEDFPAPIASAWARSAGPALLLSDAVLERAVREGLKDHFPSATPDELASSVQEVRDRLTALSEEGGGLLVLSGADSRPSRAVAAVNAVARAFDPAAAERRKRLIEDALAFLERALRDRDQERLRLAREIEKLRPSTSEAEHERVLKSLLDREERLARELDAGRTESDSLAVEIDLLMERIGRAEYDPPPPADASESGRIAREIAAARVELEHLRATRPEDVPGISAASDRVDRLRRQRVEAMDQELLATRFAPVRRMLEQLREKASRRDRLLSSFRDAQAQLESARMKIQEHRKARSAETEAECRDRAERRLRMEQDLVRAETSTAALRAHQARIAPLAAALPAPTDRIDLAAGAEPSTTTAYGRLPLWILLGLVLGAGAALALGRIDAVLQSEADVRRITNLPILGVVPRVRDEEPALVRADPSSGLSETWQTAAVVLENAARSLEAKTFMVTSAGAGEGKSTTACNLAVALARSGAQVLLVDADLRRPTQHQIFALSEDWSGAGLSAFLQQTIETVDPAITTTEIPGLSILPAGPYPGPTAPFLRSERFGAMIEGLREKYDYVLLDAPPVQGTADSLLLAPHTDAVLLALAAGETRKDGITEAKRLLAAAGGEIIGCVLNKSMAPGHGYYSYSPYSYAEVEEA
jgi:capsular exopolysaccharide synthesis family protein